MRYQILPRKIGIFLKKYLNRQIDNDSSNLIDEFEYKNLALSVMFVSIRNIILSEVITYIGYFFI